MIRKDYDRYYLDIADSVSDRSTCIRRMYGSVIVKDGEIISTGYNGAPRGCRNCSDLHSCKRKEMDIPSGERYEWCRSIHSEMNAIISASRRDMIGSTLYLSGKDALTHEKLEVSEPCMMCKRAIINAGIKKVIASYGDFKIHVYNVSDWVADM